MVVDATAARAVVGKVKVDPGARLVMGETEVAVIVGIQTRR